MIDASPALGRKHHQGQTYIAGLGEPLGSGVSAIRDALRDQSGDSGTLFDSVRRGVERFDKQMTVCWPLVGGVGVRLQKEQAERASRQVWNDLQWHVRERDNLASEVVHLQLDKDWLARQRARFETE